MELSSVKSVAVLGAGVMGSGIAQLSAGAGYPTLLFDVNEVQLSKALKGIESFTAKAVEKQKLSDTERSALLSNLKTTTDLQTVVADVIIEAIPENLALKHDVFKVLEAINSETTLFATNTSSLPVTQIAACLTHPHRCTGMHFFNPAPLMKLVEVVPGALSSQAYIDLTINLSLKFGKSPAVVKDTPGFIVNRVARHFYLEGMRCVEEGIAPFETVDALMKNLNFKMGPFALMDLIGVETNHEVTKTLYQGFFQAARFRPSRIQQKMVEAGLFGQKSGKGFYQY